MNRSEQIGELAKALSKFQEEVAKIPKDAKGNYGRFATFGSIVETIKKTMSQYGLSFSQLGNPIVDLQGNPAAGIVLETVIMHSSGEFISGTSFVPLDKITPQGFGAAMTYARRYALSAALGIVADDDDDAQSIEPNAGRQSNDSGDRPKSKFLRRVA